MKALGLSAILVLTFQMALAQIVFEPGYFIGNDGQRTQCEIRNVDWDSNPATIQYRVAGGATQEGTIGTVAEFGITRGATFRRFTVGIDRSTDVTQSLTKDRNPSFKNETLFLRQLSSGKATLYEYVDKGLKRFFYTMDGQSVPRQLVYKRYMQMSATGNYETGYAATNEQYKQQLFMDLKCQTISQKYAESLKYDRGSLMKFFTKYNQCTGTAVETYEPEVRESAVHFTLRPGLLYNSFSIDNGTTKREFDAAISLRFGVEMEIVMPFNKGLWSATFEPAYQGYSSTVPGTTFAVDYKAIDLSLSARRYLFIKESGSLYINLTFTYSLPLGGKEAITSSGTPLDISSSTNIGAGIGYRSGKFSGEFNYAFGRGLMGEYAFWQSSYGGPGLILGYQIK